MKETIINRIDLKSIDIPLTDEFVISQGAVAQAENIYVQVTLGSGITGYGEITPFPELSGQDRVASMRKAEELSEIITGKDITCFRRLCAETGEYTLNHPAVRCGFETAIMDTCCRHYNIPLWKLWGGHNNGPIETDITIPILSDERSMELAGHWYRKGFRKIKMKVGVNLERELKLIDHIHQKYPDVKFIVDANQGFKTDDAIRFAKVLHEFRCPVIMFEQPVHREDIDGLKKVKNSIEFPVAADESVMNRQELQRVIKAEAVDIVNLKIMKMGLMNAIDMAVTAHTMGMELMIGGMIESRVAMGCSLSLVAGLGIIKHLDLDTPLLLAKDPVIGGYSYSGPLLHLSDGPGLDMAVPFP